MTSNISLRGAALSLLWALATIGVYRVLVLAPLENPGSDFTPIWEAVQRYVHGVPVYNEDYSTTEPHYLYGPGANVVLAPLALFGTFGVGRWAMVFASGASVLVAVWWVARLLAPAHAKVMTLATVAVFFNTHEPVFSTIKLTNINAFLLLVMVAFVKACFSQRRSASLVAAVLLAYAVTIKPQFIVLAAVPFFFAQWWVLVGAIAVYAALFGIGWLTTANAHWYVERLVPYLAQPRPYDNGALGAVVAQHGWGDGALYVLYAVLVVGCAVALVALWPLRAREPVVFAFAVIAVGLSGAFLLGGLLQGYYCMWLVPLAMTTVRSVSPARNVVFWVAMMCMTGWVALPAQLAVFPPATLAWYALPFILAFSAARSAGPAAEPAAAPAAVNPQVQTPKY